MGIGVHLKVMRERAGLAQGDVSKTLGYTSSQFVSNWERDMSLPPSEKLTKLAELYKIYREDLVELLINQQVESVVTKLKQKYKG